MKLTFDKSANILMVEDEYFIAQEVAAALRQQGFNLIGPVGDLAAAIPIAKTDPSVHAAVLDVNLHGEHVFPLCKILRARSIPFVFATGYDGSVIPAEFAAVPRWEKPFDYDQIAAGVRSLLSS